MGLGLKLTDAERFAEKIDWEGGGDCCYDFSNEPGEKHPRAKLTERQVREIRAIRGMSQDAIADVYGVSQTNVSSILRRKTWVHI